MPMDNLYHNLAPVYEAMYQTFMDYPGEHKFYTPILERHSAKSLLELGCGTGNMAPLFMADGFHYTGMDLSKEMLVIARQKFPRATFFAGDITTFRLQTFSDAVLMLGRTISYLTKTEHVKKGFLASYDNLVPGGILVFDFIDASRFIPAVDPERVIVHEAAAEGINYRRESRWRVNLTEGFCFDWDSAYFKVSGTAHSPIGQDFSTIRSFTEEELRILLALTGFEVLEVLDKASYAFPTKVMVARKITTAVPHFHIDGDRNIHLLQDTTGEETC